MSEKNILEPDLSKVLADKKDNIFSTLNCHHIGKIYSFDKTTQSAQVEIMVLRQLGDQAKTYPLLIDIPVIFLQGGGSFIEFPIKKGDYCLVLFNDRDIDNWWTAENKSLPNTQRKHSIADGIAIVGINSKINPLSLANDRVKINCGTYAFRLVTTSGQIDVDSVGNITFNNGTEPFILGTQLVSQLTTILTALQTFLTGLNVTTLAEQASAAAAAMGTALGILNNLKSTKIKGA